ncbi:hypothetical protein HN51_024377 [Arachis hypogaea]
MLLFGRICVPLWGICELLPIVILRNETLRSCGQLSVFNHLWLGLGSQPPRTNRYAVFPSNHHSNSHNQNKNHTPSLHNRITNTNNEHEDKEEKKKQNDAKIAKVVGAKEALQKPWSLRPRKQTVPAITGRTSMSKNGEGVEAANGEGGMFIERA